MAGEQTIVRISEAKSTTESTYGRSSEYSIPTVLNFVALQREFDLQKSTLQISSLPWIVRPGQSITLKGYSTQPLRNQIYLQTPQK